VNRRLRSAAAAVGVSSLIAILYVFAPLWIGPDDGELRRVEIPSGASLRATARLLHDEGILEQTWRLRLAARLSPRNSVKAGRYELRVGTPAMRLLRQLDRGQIVPTVLTVPEGWRVQQIAQAAAESLGFDPERFLELAQRPPASWVERFALPEDLSLEGYLLPDTYHFAHGLPPEQVIETMLRACSAVLDSLTLPEGFTRHQLLTLASIVEAEAIRDDERAKIAAVYHNRLVQGWKLEADPTVAYALNKQGERLSFRDLEVDSEYNTYRRRGLPPGPINCPGRNSIVASAHPLADFDAMYFVADGEGGHVFSRTWAEHSAAVRAYRARQRAGSP
jgi:peptidoglycan lytic transglycosylase G